MFVVGLGVDDIFKYFGEEFEGMVVVVCYNLLMGVILSGDVDVIEKFRFKLDVDKIFVCVVKISGKVYYLYYMVLVVV